MPKGYRKIPNTGGSMLISRKKKSPVGFKKVHTFKGYNYFKKK